MKADLQFVHKENYGIAMELTKKFVTKYDSRPLLQYAYHKDNGDVIATDSHKLIHFYNIHGYEKDILINPKNLMAANGEFPDVDKITAKEKHTESIKLNAQQVKVWLQMFKSFNQLMKTMKAYTKVIKFNFAEEEFKAELSAFELRLNLPYESYKKPEIDKITFDIEYMKDALEVFSKLSTDEVIIFFKSSMMPFIIENEEVAKAVILPVRTY